MKTLLLLHHPRAHDSFPGPGPSRWQLPDDMLATMRWTGELPADLSLWIAIVHAGSPRGHLDGLRRIHLPLTSQEGDEPRDGQSSVLGVSLADGRSASFQLVYHPRCDFEHPFEQAGLATLLWPGPPAELDLSAHPALDEIGHRDLGRLFVGDAMACHLQAGTRLHLHAYNDGDFSPPPCFDRGCRRRDAVVDRARGSTQT